MTISSFAFGLALSFLAVVSGAQTDGEMPLQPTTETEFIPQNVPDENSEFAPNPIDAVIPNEEQSESPEALQSSSAVIQEVQSILDEQAQTDAATPAAPANAESNDRLGGGAYLKGLSSLCIVLALVLIVYALARYVFRSQGASGPKRMPFLGRTDLAERLGRIYLERGVSLHFVRTGGRVLVIGVTQNNISLVAEFDGAAFDVQEESSEEAETDSANRADIFLKHLEEQSRTAPVAAVPSAHASDPDDADLHSLRDSIRRLQEYLRDDDARPS